MKTKIKYELKAGNEVFWELDGKYGTIVEVLKYKDNRGAVALCLSDDEDKELFIANLVDLYVRIDKPKDFKAIYPKRNPKNRDLRLKLGTDFSGFDHEGGLHRGKVVGWNEEYFLIENEFKEIKPLMWGSGEKHSDNASFDSVTTLLKQSE